MTHLAIALALAGALAAPPPRDDGPDDGRPPIELRDGDRVVLVGDALIERMQQHGYLETLLTAAHPDKSISFRNLGWSGDTVFGEARAAFGTPEDGFKALVEQVKATNPTILIVGYGANESWDGEAGLPRFRAGYERLLDKLEATGAREIVMLSPITQRGPMRHSGGLSGHNPSLRRYAEEIRRIAAERGHRFVDLLTMTLHQFVLGTLDSAAHYTSEGVHLSDYGYEQLALRLVLWGMSVMDPMGPKGLMAPPRHDQRWRTVVHFATPRRRDPVPIEVGDGVVIRTSGTVTDAVATPDGLRFAFAPARLPTDRSDGPNAANGSIFVDGLPPGRYRVRCDGRPLPDGHGNVAGGSDAGIFYLDIDGSPTPGNGGTTAIPGSFLIDASEYLEQVEALRQAIIAKNQHYFHRYRPQNQTYLFGFRKHEQGNNAAELEQFDRLVAEVEAEIARLKVPKTHTYELTRIAEEDADR